MATSEWVMLDFPSNEVARVVQAAFITIVCNNDPKLKERLKFLLSIWESRATDPAIRQVHSAAVAWVEQIRTGGVL